MSHLIIVILIQTVTSVKIEATKTLLTQNRAWTKVLVKVEI